MAGSVVVVMGQGLDLHDLEDGPSHHLPEGEGVCVDGVRVTVRGRATAPAHHLPSPSRSMQVRVCVFKAVDPHGHFPYALHVLASGRVNKQHAKKEK